ncbi:hypothetical protein V8E54_010801 [Elaphomyces granulatus]
MSLPHEDLLAKDPNVEAEKKRALQYTNDSKKPNVHIGLHYELVKDEYGLPSHIHVLIGEEKHRWFKKIVYHTNHSNVERSLLNREKCTTNCALIMLPRSEIEDSEIEDYVAEDGEEPQMALTDDGGHICPAAIGCIRAKHAKEVLNLPVQTSTISDAFRKQLRAAFQNSYDMVNVIEFGKVAIQWSKKLAFTNRATERQYVFAMGNFIEFELDRIGHIDAIFVHELTRLFVKITEAQSPRPSAPDGVIQF